jgi:hypothetical protein
VVYDETGQLHDPARLPAADRSRGSDERSSTSSHRAGPINFRGVGETGAIGTGALTGAIEGASPFGVTIRTNTCHPTASSS